MSVISYNDLQGHIGHDIECVSYGKDDENVAIECINCGEVLMDFDKEEGVSMELKIYMDKNNITQRELALKLGISQRQVIRWLNKENKPSNLAMKRMEETGIL